MYQIAVPLDLKGLLLPSPTHAKLQIIFRSSRNILMQCGMYHSEAEISVCGELSPYYPFILDHGSSHLYEQWVTLVHELLHRYNDLQGIDQSVEVGKRDLENAIDEAAYRLVSEAGEDGYRDFIVALSTTRWINFEYQVTRGNPFHQYHQGILEERLSLIQSVAAQRNVPLY